MKELEKKQLKVQKEKEVKLEVEIVQKKAKEEIPGPLYYEPK